MDRTALYVPSTIADPINTKLIALRGSYSMEEYTPPLLELSPTPIEDKGERKLIALVGKAGTGKHTYLRDYYSKKGPLYIPYATGFIEQSGMHPWEQEQYINRIRMRANAELPDPYMFVTYSPHILDAMGWEAEDDVIFFHKSAEGKYYRGTVASFPQDSIRRAGYDLNEMYNSLGHMWITEGEEWLERYGEDVTLPQDIP